MLAEIKHALNTCPKDGTIYLAKSLSKKSGFFIAEGHLLYLVSNFENIEYKSLKTDYLLLNTDIEIRSFEKNKHLFQEDIMCWIFCQQIKGTMRATWNLS